MASGGEEKFAEKSSLEPERTFGMHILLLDRMQLIPEGEAARDDKSDEKANQKEPAVRGERDQQNRYDSDGDDETRRSSQAESSQAESRAAAGFRFHKFYFTGGSQTLSLVWSGFVIWLRTLPRRASEFVWLLLHFWMFTIRILHSILLYVPPRNSPQRYDFTGLTPNNYMDMDLSSIFGLNSRFGAVWEELPFLRSGSLALTENLGLSKSNGRAAASGTLWKTALRLCRSGAIVALGALRVCEGGHGCL